MLQAGCESTKGRRRNWLALGAVPSLVLVAAIGCFTAARAEAAPPPNHQSIQNSVGAVQSTLGQIPPAWSQILPAADRFQLVMGGAAVLDRETGLVWEQSPSTSLFSWLNAQLHCNTLATGGRLGWRLPTIQELASLVDQNNPGGDYLPPGHPFSIVLPAYWWIWSATTTAGNASVAWFVYLKLGGVSSSDKTDLFYVWCVRGGQGVDPQ